jgi:hypothetical protein
MSITCQDTGHHCALKSLQDLRLITQEQYDCLLKVEGFCQPGIGTNPSKILKLLNGETFGCDDTRKSLSQRVGINFRIPMDSDSRSAEPEKQWIIFNLATMEIPAGRTIPEIILEILNSKILQLQTTAPRLFLHLEGGIKGHYFVFHGDEKNPYLIDPFDENWVRKKFQFKQLPINRTDKILFLVETSELIAAGDIVSQEYLEYKLYAKGVDKLDTKACEKLEKEIMDNLTEDQKACIAKSIGETPTIGKRKHGGKTNTKKKYRAKTTISTNKYAKRHRIRRSRRKSQGNRINNGKH